MAATDIQPYIPTNPVGIDKAIEALRERLSSLSWLELPLGRGFLFGNETRVFKEKRSNKQDNDYYVFKPNDKYKAQCCFVVGDNRVFNDARSSLGRTTYRLELLVTYNMARIDNTNNYDNQEQLIIDVVRLLSQHPVIMSATGIESVTTGTSALQGYYESEDNKLLAYPLGAFRVSFPVTIALGEFCGFTPTINNC